MRLHIALLAAAATFCAGTVQAATVELKDAVLRVTVVPEDRPDIKVEIVRSNAELPLTVTTVGDRTVIDGDLRHRVMNCNGMGEKSRVRVRGVGSVVWDEIPQVVIRTPRAVSVSASGAVSGVIGRSGSLDLHNSGCSNWTIADVADGAVLHESGAGSVRMGASERLDVHLSGASHIHATRVRKRMDIQLSGAGGVNVDEVNGAMDARVSGVGHVKVAEGRATYMRASVSGLGGVEFGGVVETLDASISGLGGVRVNEVSGRVTKTVTGGGSVRIGKSPS